jgi:hypothetical protein
MKAIIIIIIITAFMHPGHVIHVHNSKIRIYRCTPQYVVEMSGL